MNTHKIVGVVDPTTDQEVATKKYVDTASIKYIQLRLLPAKITHTTGTKIGGEFRMPAATTLLDIGAYVDTAGTGTIPLTIDMNQAGSSVLSPRLTIDGGEKTSTTAAYPVAIDTSAISADSILTFDIDAIASTLAGEGLVVWMKVSY